MESWNNLEIGIDLKRLQMERQCAPSRKGKRLALPTMAIDMAEPNSLRKTYRLMFVGKG
jgi:hypothetical protein